MDHTSMHMMWGTAGVWIIQPCISCGEPLVFGSYHHVFYAETSRDLDHTNIYIMQRTPSISGFYNHVYHVGNHWYLDHTAMYIMQRPQGIWIIPLISCRTLQGSGSCHHLYHAETSRDPDHSTMNITQKPPGIMQKALGICIIHPCILYGEPLGSGSYNHAYHVENVLVPLGSGSYNHYHVENQWDLDHTTIIMWRTTGTLTIRPYIVQRILGSGSFNYV